MLWDSYLVESVVVSWVAPKKEFWAARIESADSNPLLGSSTDNKPRAVNAHPQIDLSSGREPFWGLTHNRLVLGSSPNGPTNEIKGRRPLL